MAEQTQTADFIGMLMEMGRGSTSIEASRKLSELTDAICETGDKGTFTLKLEVTPSGMKHGRVNQFEIRPVIQISKPEPKQGKSIFFVTAAGKLTRTNPDQMDMDFESVKEGVTNGR